MILILEGVYLLVLSGGWELRRRVVEADIRNLCPFFLPPFREFSFAPLYSRCISQTLLLYLTCYYVITIYIFIGKWRDEGRNCIFIGAKFVEDVMAGLISIMPE